MFPNVQGAVRAHLADALGVPVGVKVPNPRPEVFVLVRREGGRMPNRHQDRAGIGVSCWGKTEQQAYETALKAREAMFKLAYKEGFCLVQEESFRSNPDTADGNPRWYGSYTVTASEIINRKE